MKKLIMTMFLVAMFLVAMVGLFGSNACAETINIRFAHGSPRGHPNYTQCEMLGEELEKATNGRLKVAVYGDRQLGDDGDIIQLISAGTIDAGLASSVNFPLILNKVAFDALQLPFLVKSYEDMIKMLQSEVGIKLLESLDEVGLKGLCVTDGGQRNFLNRAGPVLKLEDFKGLKTRIVPIPLHKAIWELTGANPIGVPYGEVYTAMQTRVIDATEFNIGSIEADNVWEVAKHYTRTGHYFWPALIFYSKKKFYELPPDLQKIVLETSRKLTAKFYLHTRDQDILATERLKKKGLKVYEFQDREKMIERMQPVYDEWTKKHPLIGEWIEAAKKL